MGSICAKHYIRISQNLREYALPKEYQGILLSPKVPGSIFEEKKK
jgi:hypothetical protein